MSTTHTAFHWPDHVIGKRESRRIRDAHNALYNSHAELVAELEKCAADLKICAESDTIDVQEVCGLMHSAVILALAKARGTP